MVRQSERKHKAVLTTVPEADTMRTIIATVLAVLTALTLIKFSDIKPAEIHNSQTVETALASTQAPQTTEKSADVVPTPEPTPETLAPAANPTPAATQSVPSSSCAAEIGKYSNWNQNVAQAVMMAESGGAIDTHNDDASTGDYSIGCFQVNLLGTNLYSKYRIAITLGYTGAIETAPMTAWLKDPVNNVAVANRLYTLAGQWSDWKTTCSTKVSCY